MVLYQEVMIKHPSLSYISQPHPMAHWAYVRHIAEYTPPSSLIDAPYQSGLLSFSSSLPYLVLSVFWGQKRYDTNCHTSFAKAFILAIIVLFVFLQNFKSTLIIGISIPLSMIITLFAMSIFGITLNMMTLTGLILGLGMVVDASIVMIDNIYL